MGCARSKPKSRSFDSSSKSTTHTKTSKSKRTTNVTVQVPDTPVTPVDTTKQQTKTPLIPEILLTPPENDHYLQKENSLNLSEALSYCILPADTGVVNTFELFVWLIVRLL